MENPIKFLIQKKAEEQAKLSRAQSQGNKQNGAIFTDEDQRNFLHMNSIQSQYSFSATDDDLYTFAPLYEMLSSGEYQTKLTPGLFPEIRINNGITYLPSNRHVRLDKLRTQFEWYVSISKTTSGKFVINTDYRGSYVELYPDGYLLHFTATTLNSSFVNLTDAYDLSETKYHRVAVVDSLNSKIKSVANDYSNENRWNVTPPEVDKVFYVPRGLDRNSNADLWHAIDTFVNNVKSSEKMILSTTMISGANANTCRY